MRTLISLVLAAVFVPAWAAPQGDASTTTQTREVPSFNAIRVETAADLAVKVGGPLRVAVTAAPGLLQRVRTEVRGDTLVIDTKGDTRFEKPLRVEISVPELRKLELDGSGDATVEGGRGDSALSIEGSGDIRWTGDAGELRVEIDGSGNVKLAGSARQLRVDVSGSGDVDAKELRAKDAAVEVEGAGDVAVHVDGGKLRAEVSGSGDVTWSGSGTVERAVVSGSGEIRKM